MRLTKKERWLLLFYGFFIVLSFFTAAIVNDFLHIFMVWNLTLAAIPFVFSRFMEITLKRQSWYYVIIPLFILFLPNAFYPISDLIYLSFHTFTSEPAPYQILIYYDNFESWLALFHLFTGAVFALGLGFMSLDVWVNWLNRYHKKGLSLLGLIAGLLLTGLGIYIGRFFRYNSWDVVQMGSILKDLYDQLSWNMLGFIVGYAIMLLGLYGFYKILMMNEPRKT